LHPLAMVAPLHILWLHHMGHSKSNVGPHMVAQDKYGCATLNPM
jgi:hypothetical protein